MLPCPVPLKICFPSVPTLDLPLWKLKGAALKSIKTPLRALLYTMRCEESENKGYTSSGPTKNGACWQRAVSDWLRINMEMEVWEKWGPAHRPFNVPRSKYPREVAVDYELVYSINKASWVTGNLMKAKDTHTKRILHTECALRAHRGHPEGIQGHGAIL